METLTKNGGKVLFIDALPDALCTGEALPDAVRHCKVIPLDRLAGELGGLKSVLLTPASDRVRAMHYIGEQEFYYLFNEGEKTYGGTVTLPAGEYHLYDAWHDRREALNVENGKVKLCMAPSQSIFIVRGAAPQTIYQPAPRGKKLLLTKFTQSVCRAVDYPNFKNARVIEKLESYAATDKKFSGFIRYETTFICPVKTLEITQAYEGVEVFVNGQSAGIQVTAPFVYDLRDLVKPGENRLVIEVATTLERERGNTKTAAPTGITGEVAIYL